MDFRLADAARYIEEMDRQIERHAKDYRKDYFRLRVKRLMEGKNHSSLIIHQIIKNYVG